MLLSENSIAPKSGRSYDMQVSAEDIMIPLDSYPHVPHWFSLRQAIAALERSQIEVEGRTMLPQFVLVFDEKYQLIGVIRRSDILKGLGPNALQDRSERSGERDPSIQRDRKPGGGDDEDVIEHLRERIERPVSEIMGRIRMTLPHDAGIERIIETMVNNDVSFVPVLKGGKVVGVVRSTDVLYSIGNILTETD